MQRRVGRYELIGLLGQGGMGTVHRAIDTALRREVAVKLLREERVDPEGLAEARARFTREARTAARLKHPNVVTIHDVGVDGETPFFVMDLVEGRSLRQLVGGADPLSVRLRWLREIASALAAAHQAGLVHRDVKPDNVIVGTDGSARVLDFGIAKPTTLDGGPMSFETMGPTVLGTPRYMAPEQLVGAAQIDGRADQYAWGRVAFELLSGSPATRGGHLPRLDAVVPSVDRRLADLVESTQQPLASARLPSMGHVVAALDALADGGTVETRPAEPTVVTTTLQAGATRPIPIAARPVPQPRTRPWLVPVIVVSLLAGVIGLAGGAVFVIQSLAARTHRSQSALVAEVQPTPCPAPAQCVGTIKTGAGTYKTCLPILPDTYRVGEVVFVRDHAVIEPLVITAPSDGTAIKGRSWRKPNETASLPLIEGRHCAP